MESRRVSVNVVPRENWSLKSIFFPRFDSSLIENKYLLNYFKSIYPSSHRLLVLICVVNAFIDLFEIILFKSQMKVMNLSLIIITIILNICSLFVLHLIRNRLLSNVISLICICPLIVLSCLYPSESNICIIIILIYTLCNISLPLSLSISLIISIISIIRLKWRIDLIFYIIINLIGIYLNRLFEITIRSSFNQLCQSKLNICFLKRFVY
jgi:hypothetical protein